MRILAFKKSFSLVYRWVLFNIPGKGGEEAGECRFLNLSAEIARFMGVTIREIFKVMTGSDVAKIEPITVFVCV